MLIPLPGLTLQETSVLEKIALWHDQYLRTKRNAEAEGRGRYVEPLTTDVCSKRLKMLHVKMLALLNRFEAQGLVIKRRRFSGGATGYGWDGALYSEVIVLPKAGEELARYSRPFDRSDARPHNVPDRPTGDRRT